MLKISREDCRSLESKIQTEIQKIFIQFIEDLENKAGEQKQTGATQELQEHDRSRTSVLEETTPAPAKPRRHRKSIHSFDTNKILSRKTRSDGNHPVNILESNMLKILRRKQRKRAD